MQVWPTLSAELQTEWSSYEEATVYGQCVLFASRMVWLLTPFHSTDGEEMQTCEYDEDTAMIGRRENTSPWEQNEIVRFVLRVFSSICLETHLSQERVTVLRKLVTGETCHSICVFVRECVRGECVVRACVCVRMYVCVYVCMYVVVFLSCLVLHGVCPHYRNG